MKRGLTLYYVVLILILSFQAMYTVYKLGGTIGQGENIRQLQHKQAVLTQELQTLRETRSGSLSLTTLAENTPDDYTAIREPIIVTQTESVAALAR